MEVMDDLFIMRVNVHYNFVLRIMLDNINKKKYFSKKIIFLKISGQPFFQSYDSS